QTFTDRSQGSGFVVSKDGYILTNSHVIAAAGDSGGPATAAKRLFVEFQDHDRVPARIVGWDIFDDVGLIKVDAGQHALQPVPINSARRSMRQLIANGSVSYAFVGVESVDLTPSLAEHFGYPVRYGAAISTVFAGSPAARAGLRAGERTIYNESEFPRGADVV